MLAFALPPTFVKYVQESLVTICANTVGLLMLTIVTILVTAVIMKRNHLSQQRVLSNLLQLFFVWLGWALMSSWYGGSVFTADKEAVFVFVFTSVLFLCICFGVILAAVLNRYAPAPFPILRAQISLSLHRLATLISDTQYDKEQVERTKQIAQSIDALNVVFTQKVNAKATTHE